MQVHRVPVLAYQLVLQKAVQRYEHCWLPLIRRHAHNLAASPLAPPLDVAWVWFAHTIAPVAYRHVCTSIPVHSQSHPHVSLAPCRQRSISMMYKRLCSLHSIGYTV